MRRFGPVVLAFALSGGLACSGDAGRGAGPATASPQLPESLQSARQVFGEANWDLDAEPAGVPAAQRIDPASGRAVALPEAQLENGDGVSLSPLERERLAAGGAARGVSTDGEGGVR